MLSRDPLSFAAHVELAVACRQARHYDRAITELRRALEIAPAQRRGHFQLGITFIDAGRLKDAIAEFEVIGKPGPEANPRFEAYLGYAYAAGGRPADARRILRDLELTARHQYVSSFGIALIQDALGDKEAALAALDRAHQDRAVEFAMMTQYPPFKTVTADPRYIALMRLIGLPDNVQKVRGWRTEARASFYTVATRNPALLSLNSRRSCETLTAA